MGLLIIITFVVIGVLFNWYMTIISCSNRVKESLSGVDIQLKMRTDLIPNTLKIAQKFMDHELSVFNEITGLRTEALKDYNKNNSSEVSDHLAAVETLDGRLQQFLISMESYPALKSDTVMVQAQKTYNEVEAKISAARRFYNATVTELNNAVQIFPGFIIAKLSGISEMPFYEARVSEEPVNADDFLK